MEDEQKLVSFGAKPNFRKILFIQHYTCWINLDLNLNLVYFIVQNYPVTSELNQVNLVVLLLYALLSKSPVNLVPVTAGEDKRLTSEQPTPLKIPPVSVHPLFIAIPS